MIMFAKELFENIPETLTIPQCPPETIDIVFLDEEAKEQHPGTADHPQSQALLPFGNSAILSSVVKNGREVSTPGNARPIFEFWLDVPEAYVGQMRPGDSIGVFPQNGHDVVQKLIEHQDWVKQADMPFKIEFLPGSKKKKSLMFIPEQGSTIRKVLTNCIDFERPSKLFLLALLKYCTDKEEAKQTLRMLCSKEMMAVYTQEILLKRVSIVTLLKQLNVKIPFSVLVEHSNRLLPRPYSIINGTTKKPGKIRLAFSWDSEKPGLTTSMLREYIITEDKFPLYFYIRQPTGFRLEVEDNSRPLIMIGPGLGVIPYLGMLEELSASVSDTVSKRLLFTTWRNKGVDDVYLSELQQYELLSQLHFAYTRDTDQSKTYVQNLILSQKRAEVTRLLQDPDTKVYICGEGKLMIPQIESSLVQCLRNDGRVSESDAQKMLKELKANKRIIVEQWF